MPQWDVYQNPAVHSRDKLPYVVVLQSDLLTGLPTRLGAPLARTSVPGRDVPARLAPVVEVGGERLVLWAHLAAAIDARALKQPIASLRAQSHRIVDAIDAVISGV